MSPCDTVPVLPVMLDPPWLSTFVIDKKSSLSVADVLVPMFPGPDGTVTVAVFEIACGLLFVPVTEPVTV